MKSLLFVMLLATVTLTGWASSPLDEGLRPIANTELIQRIRTAAPESQQHWQIIRRAYGSDLSSIALREYERLLIQQPNNPYWNLYVGWVALDCWRMNALKPQKGVNYDNLLQTARRKLERAAQLKPDDPRIALCHGFYLWQFYNQMPQGLRIMEQSLSASPEDALILTTLGLVYFNQGGNKYSPQKAEECWLKASKLEPEYAEPLWWLAKLYAEQRKFAEANQKIIAYRRLLPEGAKDSSFTHDLISDIEKGIAKQTQSKAGQ